MSLHQLPPEILLHILHLLGSAFFQQDARRLLVSRWWYQLARPVLLQDLDFSAELLQSFILASKKLGLIRSVQKHVTTISLGLDGFKNWHSARTESSGIDSQVVGAWTSELNAYLASLASTVQKCTRLRSLRVEARPERHDPREGLERRDYLEALPLVSLVSISHLTCLEIDTAGTDLIVRNNNPEIHFCGNISALLPTLRRLRYRASSICPHILDPAGKGPLASLEDVIINLSLSEISSSDTSYRYPSRRGHMPGDSFAQLRADMEFRAKELVSRINNPRILRVLSHTFPELEMHSFDALAGRRMRLASATPWDADGEDVKETTVTEDLFDSDSSSGEFML